MKAEIRGIITQKGKTKKQKVTVQDISSKQDVYLHPAKYGYTKVHSVVQVR